uniref:Uncharacterized protein n=1 Tax=Picea glauca TaxID=3330 RepID=A0A117NIN4_PICGL|nr:hypothetical protein ABT39_MTgene83 [Picea glauca]KUM50257.1 hypothetical protein ABT39_MTgene100 [Picea glauca]QHR90748.1 hypothetical protein Q903MT_gene4774 [Picea sitchensis]
MWWVRAWKERILTIFFYQLERRRHYSVPRFSPLTLGRMKARRPGPSSDEDLLCDLTADLGPLYLLFLHEHSFYLYT